MKNLRTIHLYLGCVFAPLLLFFTVSGIWQLLSHRFDFKLPYVLQMLSTIHKSEGTKAGGNWSGPLLEVVVVIMALSFITTIILGVTMALKHGKNERIAYACLAGGVVIPTAIVLLQAL